MTRVKAESGDVLFLSTKPQQDMIAEDNLGSSSTKTWVLVPLPPQTTCRIMGKLLWMWHGGYVSIFSPGQLNLTPSSDPCLATYALLNCITSPCLNFLRCRIVLIITALLYVVVRRDWVLVAYVLYFPMSQFRGEGVFSHRWKPKRLQKSAVQMRKKIKILFAWWEGERENWRLSTVVTPTRLWEPSHGDTYHNNIQKAPEMNRPLELQDQVKSTVLELEHLGFIEESQTVSLSL